MATLKQKLPFRGLNFPGLVRLFGKNKDDILTSLPQAMEELSRRQNDPTLREKIENYFKNDIPEHFKKGPVFYLARHVATPNFETLRFLHLVDPLEMPAVIGQDVRDKFVPTNQLKHALGKLSISYGISKKNQQFHERYEHANIIDFNTASGKVFEDIETIWGEKLVDFHRNLFSAVSNRDILIYDDSSWIDRHGRGDLLEHYKKFLALFLVHGILFEDLKFSDEADQTFIKKVLAPAFRFVEREFGVRPLIVQLTPTSIESQKFWLSYPKEVADIIVAKRKPQGVV